MFMQVDCALEKSRGGLGVGLSIVKRLVQMHGGTVEARSEGEGKGSEFIVRLPIVLSVMQQERNQHKEAPVRSAARRRVLVVDDNLDAAVSLALMLKLMGHEVRTAHDGLEGVAAAHDFRPDVVILDIGMPRLNGYDACRRIREQPWGRQMVIFALTGWGQQEDKARSQAAGFDGHLVKPVQPGDLKTLLTELKSETA
jgi:CheY-like chemotaxis protein